MKLKHNLLLLFAFLSFSINCHAQLLPEKQIRFHKDYSQTGLVFGTLTFPEIKIRFDGYLLWLGCKEDGKEQWKSCGKIYLTPQMFKKKHKGELDEGRTYLFAYEKPPGQYVISGLRLIILKVALGGTYTGPDTDITGFSIPFDVKKGQITYIGNININEYAFKGEQVVTLKDEFTKDMNAIKNIHKMVNWDIAVKSTLELNHSSGTEQQN